MKKIYIIIVLLQVFFIACEDSLDTTPFQSLDEDEVFTTLLGFENAITGVYDGLQDADVYGANVVQNAELKTQYITWGGSFTSYSEVASKSMTTVNAESTRLWIDGYDVISRANKVLDALEVGLDDPAFDLEKERIKGEALFSRAIVYYELIRSFGLPYSTSSSSDAGVPINIDGTENVSDAQKLTSRSTVSQVYDQIIADLLEAELLLPESGIEDRANIYTTKAFLARVYLSMKDYTQASSYANQIITSEVFALDVNPGSSFGSSSTPETIFAIIHTSTDNLSNENDGLNDYFSPTERGDITIPQATLDLFSSGDLRLSSLFFESGGNTWSGKWLTDDANVPILRLAEMYLIRAEALFELGGNDTEVANMLNVVRNRASLADVSVTGTDLRDSIRMEFLREFVTEGHAVYDLQRWQLPVGYSIATEVGETVAWNDPNLVFPIPQREMDVNSELVQNPGY